MTGCFIWLFVFAAAIFLMVSMVRWFEQVTEAVDQRWWNKVAVLIAMPLAVWFYPSRVSAGRPTAVPQHQPVRGFGTLPKGGIRDPQDQSDDSTAPAPAPARVPMATAVDGPPPGTPKEFIGLPNIPPKRKTGKPAVDPEKIAKLKQKMREQGMLDDANDS